MSPRLHIASTGAHWMLVFPSRDREGAVFYRWPETGAAVVIVSLSIGPFQWVENRGHPRCMRQAATAKNRLLARAAQNGFSMFANVCRAAIALVLVEKRYAPAERQADKGRWHRDLRAEKGALLAAVEAVR
jgi:hypothetical protein